MLFLINQKPAFCNGAQAVPDLETEPIGADASVFSFLKTNKNFSAPIVKRAAMNTWYHETHLVRNGNRKKRQVAECVKLPQIIKIYRLLPSAYLICPCGLSWEQTLRPQTLTAKPSPKRVTWTTVARDSQLQTHAGTFDAAQGLSIPTTLLGFPIGVPNPCPSN